MRVDAPPFAQSKWKVLRHIESREKEELEREKGRTDVNDEAS